MIRIDLGKDESARAGGKAAKVIAQVRSKLGLGGGKRTVSAAATMAESRWDLRGLIVLGIGGFLGVLPHLLYVQYASFVEKQAKEAIAKMDAEIATYSTEISKLGDYQKELESYEQQKTIVRNRLTAVQGLLSVRNTPVNVLDTLGQSLPLRSWVQSIEYSLKERPSSITLVGSAYSNEDISDFIDKLAESIYFSTVELETVTTGDEKGISVKNFTVRVVAKDGASTVAATPDRNPTAGENTGQPVGVPPGGDPNNGMPPNAGGAPSP